jgi:hypothetical protein
MENDQQILSCHPKSNKSHFLHQNNEPQLFSEIGGFLLKIVSTKKGNSK